MVFWRRFMTTVVFKGHDWDYTMSGIIWSGLFCVLVVFPAALLHTVRLLRRLQYQFTRSWLDLVLVRPGRVSNSTPTSTEADTLTTRPRAGFCKTVDARVLLSCRLKFFIVERWLLPQKLGQLAFVFRSKGWAGRSVVVAFTCCCRYSLFLLMVAAILCWRTFFKDFSCTKAFLKHEHFRYVLFALKQKEKMTLVLLIGSYHMILLVRPPFEIGRVIIWPLK